jgi:ADP-heptose:LPS heptosyltransferase
VVTVLLRFPHGLGDCVQLSVILKHLAKYRPEWQVDVRVGRGKHTALIGLCRKVYHDQEPEPDVRNYTTVADIGFYENYAGYTDRPNSKITNCLQEVFGMNYDPALARYEMKLSQESLDKAAGYLRSIGAKEENDKFKAVIVHYEGNTSTWKKNLKHWQARAICDLALRAGRVPVVLDWDGRTILPDQKTIFCPGVGKDDVWGGFGSGDAGVIGALCSLSEAFVGIDSGPGKCASAGERPTLIIWKEHHPIQFHDPAANTTHLIPKDWRRVPPCEKPGVPEYFEKHYRYETYDGEYGLVEKAREWLAGVLDCKDSLTESKKTSIPYCLPNGIGDVTWVLHKIKAIADGKPIDVVLSGDPRRSLDHRALPFLKRFGFVRSVSVLDLPILRSERDEERNDEQGRYRYQPDGVRGGFHYLVPNAVLEKGERLETWMADYGIDWSVVHDFDWTDTDRGDELGKALGDFAAVYLGPESGNVDEGHNRGFLWEPKHWVTLAKELTLKGLKIVLVGAEYDRSYYERYVQEGVRENGMKWVDALGKFEIGETFALLRRARCFFSYQSGLAIFMHYLGGNVCTWWRPDGDSIHPKRLVAFDDGMKDAWTNPAITAEGKYLGCLYKRESVWDILGEIEKRGWVK